MRTVQSFAAGLFAMLIGSTAWAAACDGFSDVSDTDTTYCSAVSYIRDKGVTLGCGNGTTYCPNDYVTRLQMALFLQRFGRGGNGNVLGDYSTAIGGGLQNTATGYASVVAGGFQNVATGNYATASGGGSNAVDGELGTVLGGFHNSASGYNSLAAGLDAHADNRLCVIFSLWNSQVGPGTSCGGVAHVFRIGADHGFSVDYSAKHTADGGGERYVYIGDFSAGKTIGSWNGAYLSDAGVWTSVSDRAVKHNFTQINTAEVLARVVAIPIDRWEYRVEHDVTHIGPVAQDFYAAFQTGADDKTITSIDESGVALAAIQGLNAKLEAQVAALIARLSAMQQQLDGIASNHQR